MSIEKKPRKVVAKKGVKKKSVDAVVASPAPEQKVAASPKTAAKSLQVSIDDLIRLRAYEIYLQRGATPGNPNEDWQIAEREVREHFGARIS